MHLSVAHERPTIIHHLLTLSLRALIPFALMVLMPTIYSAPFLLITSICIKCIHSSACFFGMHATWTLYDGTRTYSYLQQALCDGFSIFSFHRPIKCVIEVQKGQLGQDGMVSKSGEMRGRMAKEKWDRKEARKCVSCSKIVISAIQTVGLYGAPSTAHRHIHKMVQIILLVSCSVCTVCTRQHVAV